MNFKLILICVIFCFIVSCKNNNNSDTKIKKDYEIIDEYAVVELKTDLSNLSNNQKKLIATLIDASKYIDSICWYINTGFLDVENIVFKDEISEKLYQINFGPWNRINSNIPFIEDVETKPLGVNFYPIDITIHEFENFQDSTKLSHYTFIRRDSLGNLITIPYHVELKRYTEKIYDKLINASQFSEDELFKRYLEEKAKALTTDEYYISDTIWLSLKDNLIDFAIGPLEVFDDKFYNCKADFQSFVLIKDFEWSKKLEKYNIWLPFLQKALPVAEKYRNEEPSSNSDIFIYDVVYIAGSAKTGGVTISQNLPLDQKTQSEKGIRNLQFKNIINTKFEAIVKPISQIIFDDKQVNTINSEAFFSNVLYSEMGKSLGVKNTINSKGSVRDALKDYFTITDVLKSSVLTLYFAEKLNEVDEINYDIINNYTTFIANIIRVIRLGESSEHAIANLVCYNYLTENQGISYNDNKIIINYDKMKKSIEELSKMIITLQGDGDYLETKNLINKYSKISTELEYLLNEIDEQNIPKDVYIEQGVEFLNI